MARRIGFQQSYLSGGRVFIFIKTLALALEHCEDPEESLKAALQDSAATGSESLHELYSSILKVQVIHNKAQFQQMIEVLLFFFFFCGGRKGNASCRAPCVGPQYGLPLGLLVRWTFCRLTYPLKPFHTGGPGYIPLGAIYSRAWVGAEIDKAFVSSYHVRYQFFQRFSCFVPECL